MMMMMIITTIITVIVFMQDSCSYIPETNPISRVGYIELQLFWIYNLCCM